MITAIIIPARKGSKGLPGKNTREFRGFPLVEWSFAAGLWLKARMPGAEVVCTSDDPTINALVDEHYANRIAYRNRPKHLASDVAGMAEVVLDAAREAKRYILLQPTTPLRLTTDLLKLSTTLKGATSTASCTAPFEAPDDLIHYPSGERVVETKKTATRQAREQQFGFVDGAFYAGSVTQLRDSESFLHSDTSYYLQSIPMGADIDTSLDWDIAEVLHDRLKKNGVEFVQPDR